MGAGRRAAYGAETHCQGRLRRRFAIARWRSRPLTMSLSRRRGGKSDQIDAVRAARQALAAPGPAQPRTGDTREALRILLATREHATKTRTATVNTLKALILTAPEDLRAQFRGHRTAAQVRTALALPSRPSQPVSEQHLRQALRQLARQISDQDATLKASLKNIRGLVRTWMPALLAEPGIGPISAAGVP